MGYIGPIANINIIGRTVEAERMFFVRVFIRLSDEDEERKKVIDVEVDVLTGIVCWRFLEAFFLLFVLSSWPLYCEADVFAALSC